jgi:SAM-dependent methyltransferase
LKTYSTSPRGERQKLVRCDLCGSDRCRPVLRGEGFRFVRCLHCGLVYQNPQPLFEDLRSRYGRDYFHYELENERNFFQLMKLGLRDIQFDRLARAFGPGRTFLDVGCATGMLLAFQRSRGFRVQGVELCRESAEHGRRQRNLPIFIGTLEQAAFPEGSFSVVHFSHLIEHLTAPASFLREVHRILARDGLLIVVTPNIAGLQARLLGPRWRSAIADHLHLFSRRTLVRMLELTGFRALETVTWGGLAKGVAPAWIKRPADVLAKRWGFGDVVLALARRV